MPSLTRAALRILVLCYEWPPVGGGGGRAAQAVAEVLVRRGHAVAVQTVRVGTLLPRENEDGVTIFRARGFRRHFDRCTPLEMAGYLFGSFVPCLRLLRDFRPDLLHAHFAVPTGVLAYAVSRLWRVPYVLTAHLGDVPGAIPEQTDHLFRWLNPFIRPIWQKAAAVTAVSAPVALLGAQAYGRKLEIIPNGISLQNRGDEPAPRTAPPRFLFVGRLNPQKNLAFVLPLLALFRHLPWSFEIVGDGAERASLEAKVQELDLGGRVRFHGWLARDGVQSTMAVADIFILPSRTEGLSLALLEALKWGLAVLAAPLPALESQVTDGENGFVCSLQDLPAWRHALEHLLSDEGLRWRMRRASWRRAGHFDIEQVATAYERLFQRFGSRGAADVTKSSGVT